MAQNKNALIRYKTIDKCLQNSFRKWTLEDLIDACSDALHEYEDRDVNVSKRTVQLDIQLMRSDKLGYNAPIEVYEKKYYRYEDPEYSITDIPITENDMDVLSETVEVLKQFKDFSLFSELGGIIQRLEDKVYCEKNKQSSVIHLEKNENLKGLEHLDTLYQSIIKQVVLTMNYQSFKARKSSAFDFHPYILKQFNSRWFVVGLNGINRQILTLALDRIQSMEVNLQTNFIDTGFDGDSYYKNTIGVTVLREEHVMDVEILVDRSNAPYVLTKPFHSSQELIEKLPDHSMRFSLRVHLNFELERLLLGFGDSIEVIKPKILRNKIKRKLKKALLNYVPKET